MVHSRRIEYTCQGCGVKGLSAPGAQRRLWCSTSCRSRAKQILVDPKDRPITCKVCEKVFYAETAAKSINRKYCGHECRQVGYQLFWSKRRDKLRKIQVEKPCKACGNMFMPHRANHNICTEKCSRAYFKAKYKRIYDEKICLNCGDTFLNIALISQKFCKVSCGREYTSRTNKEKTQFLRDADMRRCVCCGDHFSGLLPTAIFCSDKCQRKHHKKYGAYLGERKSRRGR